MAITASSVLPDNSLEDFRIEFNNLVTDVDAIQLANTFGVSIIFEGATTDQFETSLGVVDPTADNSILLPNVSGNVIIDGNPISADGAALGSATLEWSDIYLADGGVIYFGDDQDVTLTHVADTGLTLNLMMAATTFEPSADTAAGDNAAIGYTSAEGLILTGQGSTNDITVKNDADADVITIATGTTVVGIPGSLDVEGAIDVNGTSNLDVVDIDGAVDMASTLQVDGAITGSSTIQGTTITATTAVVPDASDGAALGTTALEWSDLYLADGAVINFGDDQDITLTHTADTGLTTNGTFQATTITATTAVVPDASDGAALGTTALEWSDLYLADGAVIYFGDDQDVSLTHIADTGLRFPDGDQLQFGADPDLSIKHTGSHSYIIDSGTGSLYVAGSNVAITNAATDEYMIQAAENGAVTLYHNAVATVTTATTGITIGTAGAAATLSTASAGTSNLTLGVNAGNSIASGGNYNVTVGDEAGTAITTGDDNVAVGYAALDANTTGTDNVAVGYNALGTNITGTNNTAVGTSALAVNTTGATTPNVAIGYNAMIATTSGGSNVAVGSWALDANTTGASNVAMGQNALTANTTASNNTAVGMNSLAANTTAANNVAVGVSALLVNTTGSQNVAVGNTSLDANTTGANNVAVGQNALTANTTAGSNVAMGINAMLVNTTGANNTAVGAFALDANTTGANNVAVGNNALGANVTTHNSTAMGNSALVVTTGASNTAFGAGAGIAVTTGVSNVLVGYIAGDSITTGNYNVMIGQHAEPSAVGGLNQIVIGDLNQVGKGNSTGFIAPSTGAVYQGNNSTAWTATSDRRIKKDIKPSEKGLKEINQLVPCTFFYKSNEELNEIPEFEGCRENLPQDVLTTSAIAQEVREVFPEAVIERNDYGMLSVNNDPITWAMVNAIKELSAEIDELKVKLSNK